MNRFSFARTAGSLFLLAACGTDLPSAKPAADPAQTTVAAPSQPARAPMASPITHSDAPARPASTSTPAPAAQPAVVGAPTKPVEAPITDARLYLTNDCAKRIEYCVEDGASTLNTSLNSNTSTSHSVRVGARIKLKANGSCGTVVYTAKAERDEQKVLLCKR